ncbi:MULTISPECIES: GNAT family N-acetyltransferase [unclassified Paenibacillus]
MSSQGKINFLWVDPKHRNQGLGCALLHRAAEIQKIEKVYICLSDNDSLEGFIQKIGLSKDPIEQNMKCVCRFNDNGSPHLNQKEGRSCCTMTNLLPIHAPPLDPPTSIISEND